MEDIDRRAVLVAEAQYQGWLAAQAIILGGHAKLISYTRGSPEWHAYRMAFSDALNRKAA